MPVHMPWWFSTAPAQLAFPSFVVATKVNPSPLAPAITRGSLRVPLASSGLSARGGVLHEPRPAPSGWSACEHLHHH